MRVDAGLNGLRTLLIALGISGSGAALPVFTPSTGQTADADARLVSGRVYLSCAWIDAHRPDLACQASNIELAETSLARSPRRWSISPATGTAYPNQSMLAAYKGTRPLMIGKNAYVAVRDLRPLFGLTPAWNRGTLVLDWTPKFKGLQSQLDHGTLGSARRALAALRPDSLLTHDRTRDDSGAGPFVEFFPEGEARRVYTWHARVLSAYEVRDHRRVLVWQAESQEVAPPAFWTRGTTAGHSGTDALMRLTGPLLHVNGQRAALLGRLVYRSYRFSSTQPGTAEIIRGWVSPSGAIQPSGSAPIDEFGTPLTLPGEGRRD